MGVCTVYCAPVSAVYKRRSGFSPVQTSSALCRAKEQQGPGVGDPAAVLSTVDADSRADIDRRRPVERNTTATPADTSRSSPHQREISCTSGNQLHQLPAAPGQRGPTSVHRGQLQPYRDDETATGPHRTATWPLS